MGFPVLPGHQAVHGTAAAVRPEDTAEDLDGGALSRTVGADVAYDLAVRNGKGDPLKGRDYVPTSGDHPPQGTAQARFSPPDPVGLDDFPHFDHIYFSPSKYWPVAVRSAGGDWALLHGLNAGGTYSVGKGGKG